MNKINIINLRDYNSTIDSSLSYEEKKNTGNAIWQNSFRAIKQNENSDLRGMISGSKNREFYIGKEGERMYLGYSDIDYKNEIGRIYIDKIKSIKYDESMIAGFKMITLTIQFNETEPGKYETRTISNTINYNDNTLIANFKKMLSCLFILLNRQMYLKTLGPSDNNNINSVRSIKIERVLYSGGMAVSYLFNENDEDRVIRVFGGKNNSTNKNEFLSSITQSELSKKCPKYICQLYEYGVISADEKGTETLCTVPFDTTDTSSKSYNCTNQVNNTKNTSKIFVTENGIKPGLGYYQILERGDSDLFNSMNVLIARDKFNYIEKKLKINACLKLAQAVQCLHNNGYIHRDLKEENIIYINTNNNNDLQFYAPESEIKLIDFGFVKQAECKDIDCEDYAGSLMFINPRNLYVNDGYQRLKLNYKLDIYALGKIFANILYNDKPIRTKREKNNMSNFKLTLELLSYSEVRPEKILKERHDDIIDQFVNYYKKES